jgi:hypothetical protein
MCAAKRVDNWPQSGKKLHDHEHGNEDSSYAINRKPDKVMDIGWFKNF